MLLTWLSSASKTRAVGHLSAPDRLHSFPDALTVLHRPQFEQPWLTEEKNKGENRAARTVLTSPQSRRGGIILHPTILQRAGPSAQHTKTTRKITPEPGEWNVKGRITSITFGFSSDAAKDKAGCYLCSSDEGSALVYAKSYRTPKL